MINQIKIETFVFNVKKLGYQVYKIFKNEKSYEVFLYRKKNFDRLYYLLNLEETEEIIKLIPEFKTYIENL